MNESIKLILISFLVILTQNVLAIVPNFDSLLVNAELEYKSGNYAEALKINHEALKLAKSLNDCPKQLMAKYQVGRSYHFLSKRKIAINLYKEVVQQAESCKIDSMLRKSYYSIGAIYVYFHETDSAEYYLKKAEPFMKNAPFGEAARFHSVFSAFYLDHRNNIPLCEIYAQKGIDIAEKSNNLLAKAFAQIRMGSCAWQDGDILEANKRFNNSLELYTESGYVEGQIFALGAIGKTYVSLNNADAVFETMTQIQLLKDSVYNSKSAAEIANYQTLYETEVKETALKTTALKLKNQKQQTFYTLLIAVSILVIFVLVAAFLYLRYQTQKRLELVNTKEKERNRIARELHDNIGSTVSFIVSKLDSIIFNINTETEKTELTKVKKSAQEVMLNLRETLWTLNNSNITNIELADKLKYYIKKYSLIQSQITDEIEQEIILPNEVVLAIYRCVQEIINNANKHSKADLISIDFQDETAIFFIKIKDNGIGFVETEKAESYGLRNIKSRLEEIGARLVINSKSDIGTQIEITYSE